MGAELLQITVNFTVPDHDALQQRRPGTTLHPDDVAELLRQHVRDEVDGWYRANPDLFACEPDVA